MNPKTLKIYATLRAEVWPWLLIKKVYCYFLFIRIWKDDTEKRLLQSAVFATLFEQRIGEGRAFNENRGSQNYGERLRWNLGKTPLKNEFLSKEIKTVIKPVSIDNFQKRKKETQNCTKNVALEFVVLCCFPQCNWKIIAPHFTL